MTQALIRDREGSSGSGRSSGASTAVIRRRGDERDRLSIQKSTLAVRNDASSPQVPGGWDPQSQSQDLGDGDGRGGN